MNSLTDNTPEALLVRFDEFITKVLSASERGRDTFYEIYSTADITPRSYEIQQAHRSSILSEWGLGWSICESENRYRWVEMDGMEEIIGELVWPSPLPSVPRSTGTKIRSGFRYQNSSRWVVLAADGRPTYLYSHIYP
jgi:hypothetical protein